MDVLRHVEALLSLYRPDSQVSRLNRDGAIGGAHPHLQRVLNAGLDMSRRSDGAFDVTVTGKMTMAGRMASRSASESVTGGPLESGDARLGAQHDAASAPDREREPARRPPASARVGEEGKLFGSVTSSDIAHQLEAQGFAIEKRQIDLHEPIRALGVYRIPIRLHADVHPEIKVWVIKQ